jgi:nitrogen regulatory protein PII
MTVIEVNGFNSHNGHVEVYRRVEYDKTSFRKKGKSCPLGKD